MKRFSKILPFLLIATVMIGCAAKNPVQANHPNALNNFDSYAYDTLLTAQAALEGAKAQINLYPQAKPILNQAIAAYNTAQASYKVYHTAGGGDITQLQMQLTDVVTAVAQVQKAFGAKL